MNNSVLSIIIFLIFFGLNIVKYADCAEGEFEYLQWAIYNDGKAIEIPLSDIDRIKIPAKKGEDIGVDSTKGKKILVAVLDSGIDLEHPDLINQIYKNPKECHAKNQYEACLKSEEGDKKCHLKWAKYDSDNNGYPMDCQGWNLAAPINEFSGIQGNNDVKDEIGHGSFVSGIIAAEANHLGIRGVSPNITILPVKISGSQEEVDEENSTDIFAKGLIYAMKMGAKVINLSVGWASNEDSVLVTDIIKKALDKGVIIIAAGGNSAHSDITYPCSYSGVICVGSHDPDGKLSYFSNFGSSIDLFAPGRKILSTWPLNLRPKDFVQRHGYEYKNGTSFAAPYVAGAAAHLLSLGFSPNEVRAKLIKGARGERVSDKSIGRRLDLKKAIVYNPKNYIAPFKKSPGLINWAGKEKKVRFSFKNYLNPLENVKVKISYPDNSFEFLKDEYLIQNWKINEVKEFDFVFKNRNQDFKKSRLNFNIKISTDDYVENFPMQGSALTIIHPKLKREGIIHAKYRGKLNLNHFEFFPFKNITPYENVDQLLVKKEIQGVKLSLLKHVQNNNYINSPIHEFKIKNAFIGHTARVSSKNGLKYYVFIFYQNSESKWKTKLLGFDEKFKPIKNALIEGDEFDNILTTMPGDIRWIRNKEIIEPCWISQGFIPKEDLPALNPWDGPISNDYLNRLYCISHLRLQTSYIEDEKRIVGFIPQTIEEKRNLKFRLLLRTDNFVSQFFMAPVSNRNHLKELNYFFTGSLNNIIPHMDTVNNHSFIFYKDFSTNENYIYSINAHSRQIEFSQINHFSLFDPLQMVLSGNKNDGFYGLTKYNLIFAFDKKVYETESLNTNRLNQYLPIRGENSLYLSSRFTPGFYSEFIFFDGTELLRDPNKSFLPFHGCLELPTLNHDWDLRQYAQFYCDETKSFFFIPLNK